MDMTSSLHLLRNALHIPDIEALVESQEHFRSRTPQGKMAILTTAKRMPQKSARLLDGGSVYWVIQNKIQARQAILDIEKEGDAGCRIYLDPQIIEVAPRAKRGSAINDWRYLQGWDRPKDLK